jgi:hypothetical protein
VYFLLFFVVDSRQLAGPPPSRTRCAPDEEDESSLRNKSPNEGAKLEGKKKKSKSRVEHTKKEKHHNRARTHQTVKMSTQSVQTFGRKYV